MTKIHTLAEQGQSVWLDHISRKLIASGALTACVQIGVRGVTSNPAIYEKSIVTGNVYDSRIKKLAMEGLSPKETCTTLIVDEIRKAADILRPVFLNTKGGDGFVSMEIDPHLAHEKDGSVEEAERLFRLVNRPNVMIKIPATAEGLLAAQKLVAEGINVNVTLIFSLSQYKMTAEAHISALENYAPKVETLTQVSSIASLPVNLADIVVDEMLEELGTPAVAALKGKTGVANAKLIHHRFMQTFKGRRWDFLAGRGAWEQHLLFRSTSARKPAHPEMMYVDSLIGPYSVNSMKPKTLEAFMDHGSITPTLDRGLEEARKHMKQLNDLGIDMQDVTRKLLDEEINNLKKPYDRSIEAIKNKQVDFIVT